MARSRGLGDVYKRQVEDYFGMDVTQKTHLVFLHIDVYWSY
jgi:hypothetical protein